MRTFLWLVAFVLAAHAETTPDEVKIADFVEITRNGADVEPRASADLESSVEDYIKTHDATFKLPFGATVTLGARNLDNSEVDLRLNFEGDSQVEPRRKKSKLKKIFVPIFVFVLVKAMILIPLALGILAIKTWNALQLSFGSFVIALALGVWQLCKKVAGDSAHPQIIAHGGWDDKKFVARSFDAAQAQTLAYSAYADQS